MECQTHANHTHVHSEGCGHTRIQHEGHWDYVHNGHLHAAHGEHYDECVVAVSDANPNVCAETECACAHDDCGHERVPHGDHFDYLVSGRLHHQHGGHCDDHGAVVYM